MFQYLIRSLVFVNLVTGSSRLLRICQYSGRGKRCRKSLVNGDFVHAWATCCLVQPQCFVDCILEVETETQRRAWWVEVSLNSKPEMLWQSGRLVKTTLPDAILSGASVLGHGMYEDCH